MMRKVSFGVGVFLMCLLLVLSPSVAFGEDRELEGGVGVGWAGEVEGGNYAVHARALNKYNAACWAMGVNPLTISTVNRSKLSDPNYGGDFYVYAQSFTNIIGWDDVPGWMPTYATLTFVMYGFDNQWASEVSKSLYDSAKADFKRVLAGEDVGGTPVVPPVTDDEYMYFRGNPLYLDGTGYNYSYFSSGGVRYSLFLGQTSCTLFPAPLTVRVPLSVVSDLLASYPTDSIPWFIKISYYNGAIDGCEILIGNLSVTYSTVNGVEGIKSLSGNYRYATLHKNYFTFDGSTSTFTFTGDGHGALGSWGGTPQSGQVTIILGTDFVSAPPAPDGQWPEPETPATPEPPVVPTPTAPTDVPDPTPTDPTVVWPTAPIIVNPPEVTVEVTPSGLDYTQLLTEINDNLLSIDSYTKAINSSLNSLRSDLVSGFDDVVSAIRNVYQYLQHLDSILEVHCKHIRDSIDQNVYELELYLKQLFEWLPKQLDFDASLDYDDSAVTTLLRSILNKIPGSNGNPNTFKPNPQADEPGFFDWLLDLWHRFLIDLVSVLPDELGGLVDAFSQLTHYFPFSIPWDLAALLALFEHEPVTPVFDIPWGFGGDEGQVQNIRIDLSCWDGVMAMVRPVFLVGFCFQLAMITKDLLSGFDLNKGGV